MDRDRGSALSGFVRALCTNPSGDGAARALVMGALAPLGGISGQIYGSGRPATLELLGNFGWGAKEAAAFRTLTTGLPLPVPEAFTSASTIALPLSEMRERYPAMGMSDAPELPPLPDDEGRLLVVCVPIIWTEQPVGVLVAVISERPMLGPHDWQYLEGVAGALGLWMLEQRRSLIDNWRKTAPIPHAEIRLSPRQHRILELVGNGSNDAEIADGLGISIHMIRQDISEMMGLLGSDTRDGAAGRARDIGLLPDRRVRDGRAS